MPATKRLVVDLPVEQADWIEAEVASGRYASPGAYLSARLAEEDALPSGFDALDWDALTAEGEAQARRIAAGEEQVRSAEAVFTDLEARIRARAAAHRAT